MGWVFALVGTGCAALAWCCCKIAADADHIQQAHHEYDSIVSTGIGGGGRKR